MDHFSILFNSVAKSVVTKTPDRIHVSAVQFLIQKWDASVDIWMIVMLLSTEDIRYKGYPAKVVAGEEQVGGVYNREEENLGKQWWLCSLSWLQVVVAQVYTHAKTY